MRRLLEEVCDLSLPHTTYYPLPTFFSAWGSEELDGRSFALWQAGHGLVLDRMAFDEWLLGAAEAAGVTVVRGCRIAGGHASPEGWLLTGLIDGHEQTLAASFIVEATGRRARSVLQPDVRRFFTDDLVCLSIELPECRSDHPIAMIESCSAGWWYSVRLPNVRRIVALFTGADLVGPSEARLDWLNTVLNTTVHIRRLVDRLPTDARLQVWDARTSARNVLWRRTWISIGDAAWCLDPLSGVGIERAVNDGINVAVAVSRAMTSGDPEQLRSHAVSRAHSFRQALAVQRRYYRVETRWRDTVFWRRRM
jgi:flavin-dependent dehydrogenase